MTEIKNTFNFKGIGGFTVSLGEGDLLVLDGYEILQEGGCLKVKKTSWNQVAVGSGIAQAQGGGSASVSFGGTTIE